MKSVITSVSVSLLFLGCAANQGTNPHDMSLASHEQSAAQEEQAAAEHEGQHDPAATKETSVCSGKGGCWTSVANPTAEHSEEAQHHRELAAKHRAASQALAQAEGQACAGISDDDRDMSPFAHREDIRSVAPLEETQKVGKGTVTKRVGEQVVFRALPGMTAEWLQRVVDCHVARSSAAGHEMPEMPYCLLALKGVTATVASVGDGFAINVKAADPATLEALSKRAEALSKTVSPGAATP